MPISEVTTDYAGRTRDINVLGPVDPSLSSVFVHPGTIGNPSSYITGVQKLVQRYAISFMTVLGSQPDFSDFGTRFSEAIYAGALISNNDIQHLFAFANDLVLQDFREYQSENTDLPEDEQIDTAYFDGSELVGSTAIIRIIIQALSGESVPFVLPLPNTARL